MANKDYFDRIADALEIISGDDSHINDIDKNMDYYKRIAQALENIAENGSSSGGGSGGGVMIAHGSVDESAGTVTLDKTWQEIADAVLCFIIGGDVETMLSVDFITEIGRDGGRYSIGTTQYTFYAESPNDYPVYTL